MKALVVSLAMLTLVTGCERRAENDPTSNAASAGDEATPKTTALEGLTDRGQDDLAPAVFEFDPPSHEDVVSIVTASEQELQTAILVIARVGAAPQHVREVASPVDGRLGKPNGASEDWTLPRVGERVRKDQMLASVVADDVIPQALRSPVRRQRQAKYSDSDRILHLRSPLDGVILTRAAHPGREVGPTHVVFRVAATVPVVVRVPVGANDRVHIDAQTSLVLLPEDGPPRVLTAANRLDIGGPIDDLRYLVDKATEGLDIGRNMNAALRTGPSRRHLALPATSIDRSETRPAVYVQMSGGRFARQEVVLEGWDGLRVGVRAGIRAGDRVASQGIDILRAGFDRRREQQ